MKEWVCALAVYLGYTGKLYSLHIAHGHFLAMAIILEQYNNNLFEKTAVQRLVSTYKDWHNSNKNVQGIWSDLQPVNVLVPLTLSLSSFNYHADHEGVWIMLGVWLCNLETIIQGSTMYPFTVLRHCKLHRSERQPLPPPWRLNL